MVKYNFKLPFFRNCFGHCSYQMVGEGDYVIYKGLLRKVYARTGYVDRDDDDYWWYRLEPKGEWIWYEDVELPQRQIVPRYGEYRRVNVPHLITLIMLPRIFYDKIYDYITKKRKRK